LTAYSFRLIAEEGKKVEEKGGGEFDANVRKGEKRNKAVSPLPYFLCRGRKNRKKTFLFPPPRRKKRKRKGEGGKISSPVEGKRRERLAHLFSPFPLDREEGSKGSKEKEVFLALLFWGRGET